MSALQAYAYHHASDIPQTVWHALSQNEASANVILPFANKATSLPLGSGNQLWIAILDEAKEAELVLSCTRGPLGNYPVFIVDCRPAKHSRDLTDVLNPLIRRLLQEVAPERVFSVFSTTKVAERFAEILEAHVQQHGIQKDQKPYYDATLAICTRATLSEPQDLNITFPLRGSEDIVITLCRADMSHLDGVTCMCHEFSKTSWPYTLDNASATLEATTMINNNQAWVHLVQQAGQEPEMACLVATTRESDNVTAVTKVFTVEQWRRRGCALRLLHRVCQEILKSKRQVVLYVGNSDKLMSARTVYERIGFQGLGHGAEDGERWLEIGFKGTELGYW